MSEVSVSDLLGKPFEMGGRGPDAYDCYGLCLEIAARAGVEIVPADAKAIESIADLCLRSAALNAGKIDYEKLSKPEPFCLVGFKIRPPYLTHMGIVLEDCRHFIHIMRKRSVAVERLDLACWRKRLDGFYRYKFADRKDQKSV